jgi:hypothetical protein
MQQKPKKRVSAIQIFDTAYKRAEWFLSGQRADSKGRRAHDDLRAAVVFAVAAVDAFTRAKVIGVLRTRRVRSRTTFKLPEVAKELLRKYVTKETFKKEYGKALTKRERAFVDSYCDSSSEAVILDLQEALQEMSFQSLPQIDLAIRLMGCKQEEVWSRLQTSAKKGTTKRRGKVPAPRVQLSRMFARRHIIVHEADLNIQSRTLRGKARKITYPTVRRWVTEAHKLVKQLDSAVDSSG